jgi:hypothetical protein
LLGRTTTSAQYNFATISWAILEYYTTVGRERETSTMEHRFLERKYDFEMVKTLFRDYLNEQLTNSCTKLSWRWESSGLRCMVHGDEWLQQKMQHLYTAAPTPLLLTFKEENDCHMPPHNSIAKHVP